MKSWLALVFCVLFGGAVANHGLPPNKILEYDYKLVAASSIPNLGSNQYAAFVLKSKLKIQTVNDKTILAQMQDIKVGKENKEFDSISPDDIQVRVSSNQKYNNLTKQFMIEYEADQTIKNVYLAKDIGEWAGGIQKAVADMFQVHQPDTITESNRHNRGNENEEISSVLEIMEPSHTGVCNSRYSYQTKNNQQSQSQNRQQQTVEITKVKDYRDCKIQPYFAKSTHRPFKCTECESQESHPLTQNTIYKYKGIWENGNYIIQEAIGDGAVKISPLGQKADGLLVQHNRSLTLQRMSSGQSNADPSSLNLWAHKLYTNLTEKLISIRNPTTLDESVILQEICDECVNYEQQASNLIRQAARLLVQNPSVQDMKKLPDIQILLQRAMVSLDFRNLQKLERQFQSGSSSGQEQQVARKLFWDAVAQAATNPAFKMTMEAHKNRQITPQQTASLLPRLALHVANPNTLLTDTLTQFCMSQQVQSQRKTQAACFLALGNVIAKTCAKDEYELPDSPLNFCHKSKREQYVKAYEQQLEQTDDDFLTVALLRGLGAMAVKEALPVIESYIRSKDGVARQVQQKAIFSLIPLCKQEPELLSEPLKSVLFNPSEKSEVRISAFIALVTCRPERHLFEQMATHAQYEEDKVLRVFMYKTFKALANTTHPCLADSSSHAENALNMMDEEDDASAWTASVSVVEGIMKDLDADTYLQRLSVGEAGSLVPSMASLKLQAAVADYVSDILSISGLMNDTGYLMESLFGPYATLNNLSWRQRLESMQKPLRNMGLDQLAQKIGYVQRNQPEFYSMFFVRAMDFATAMYEVDSNDLLEALNQASQNGRSDNQYQINANVHKMIMPSDTNLFMPTDSGLQIYSYSKVAITLALEMEGKAKTDQNSRNQPMNWEVEVKAQARIAAAARIVAGVRLPEDEGLVASGYDNKLAAIPFVEGKWEIQAQQKQLSVTYKPSQQSQSSSSSSGKEIAQATTDPVTMIDPIFEFKPWEEVSKTIHVNTADWKEIEVLGESLVLRAKHEQEWDDQASYYKYLRKNFKLGLLTSGWLTQQWVPREYIAVWKNPRWPEWWSFDLEWDYQPAKSHPDAHVNSAANIWWRKLFGFSDVPLTCKYRDENDQGGSNSNSNSRESNEDRSYYQYGRPTRTPDNAQSSGESSEEIDFRQSKEQNGRWMGWRSKKPSTTSSQQDSNQDYSSQRNQERWGKLGWSWKTRNDESQQSQQQSQQQSRESSSQEGSGRGNWRIVKAKIGEGRSVLVVRAEAKMKTDSVKGYKAELVWSWNHKAAAESLNMKISPLGDAPNKKVCFHATIDGEHAPCFFGPKIPDMRSASVNGNANLVWGSSCDNPESSFKLKMTARKSREQEKLSRNDKPYFYEQCKQDQQQGQPMSDACMQKTKHLTNLDFVEATLKYENIPRWLKNKTEQLQDYILYRLYPHLSHDAVAQNKQDQIRFIAIFDPVKPVADVQIKKPTETIQLNRINYGKAEPLIHPPSISGTNAKQLLEYYTDGDIAPTCIVSDEYINDLNNNTFDTNFQDGCKYLITGDCTEANTFAAYIQNVTVGDGDNTKILSVNILKNEIKINPTETEELTINQQKINMEDDTVYYLKDDSTEPGMTAYVAKKKGGLYVVVLPFNSESFLFNGKDVKVVTQHIWRKKRCGVCGERNTQQEEPFIGPRKCSYSQGSDFANAYAVRGGQCQIPRTQGQKNCNAETTISRHISSQSSCYMRGQIIRELGNGKKCVSQESFRKCKPGCQAQSTKTVTADFRCFKQPSSSEEDSTSSRWQRNEQSVYSAQVNIPTRCVPKN